MSERNDAAWLLGAGAGGAALWWLARRANADAGRDELRAMIFGFGRPVPADVRAIVSSGWGRPRGKRLHRALDIPVPVGTPVIAIDDGAVVRVRREDRSDAGIWVGVLHASGVVSRYLHLSQPLVNVGQRVKHGDRIGLSGNTGNSAGPHLHLDLRVPAYMLPMVGRWIAVPRDGWGPDLEPYGYSIPGEPLIPVDGYRDVVAREAKAAGIPLHAEVHRGK